MRDAALRPVFAERGPRLPPGGGAPAAAPQAITGPTTPAPASAPTVTEPSATLEPEPNASAPELATGTTTIDAAPAP